ncbi:MAG TPA: hypothetical protein VNV41_03470 [Candidatus Acidoferrales bacterium]|nr:hypothetical protein [Candidatus Acidoferrales bacterium]
MRFSRAIGIVLCAFASFGAACHGQAAPQPPKTVVVHRYANVASLSSLPDWAGIWTFDFPTPGGPPPEVPSLTRASAAELKVLQDEEAKNQEPATESANCLPPGMPTIMFQPYDIEFLFTPGRVTIIQEAYMQVRRVFTDGRGHPADLDPTFNGHSIGHWEGDTLVIDTAGLGHKTPLGYNRLQHGPHLDVVERIHLTAPDKMEDDMTLTDPDVLLKPWHLVRTYTRHRDFDQLEFICEENNRNPIDQNGNVSTILRH